MARPGFRQHPKFKRLMHILKQPEFYCFGLISIIWETAYERGSDFIGDEVDVEVVAGWPGDPGVLCAALVQCRLIDELPDGMYQVHDLMENCPDYVRKRLVRETERKIRGKDLSEIRRQAGILGNKSDKRKLNYVPQTSANGPQTSATVCHLPADGGKSSHPQTSPDQLYISAPPHQEIPDTRVIDSQTNRVLPKITDNYANTEAWANGTPFVQEFNELFGRHPNKEGRLAALRAWGQVVETEEILARVQDGHAAWLNSGRWSGQGVLVVQFKTFLLDHLFDDPPFIAAQDDEPKPMTEEDWKQRILEQRAKIDAMTQEPH